MYKEQRESCTIWKIAPGMLEMEHLIRGHRVTMYHECPSWPTVSEAIHHTVKVGHLGSVSKQAQRSQRICKNSPDFQDTYQSWTDAFPWLIPKDLMVAVPYDQLTNKTRKTWLWFLGSDPSGMRVWVIPSNKTSKPAKVIAEGMNKLEQMIKKERWWVLVVTSGLADQWSYTI